MIRFREKNGAWPGELAVNFGATKDGHRYSIYVEVSSSGRVIVFDALKLF